MAYMEHYESIGSRLCKIFGLDPTEVFSLQIDVRRDSVAAVRIEKFVTNSEGESIVGELEEYELHPKEKRV